MLYIDEITLHNFKSFRNGAIKLSPGFNCIVGPNGSGKSNVCDALLFALGETSLKRLRINSSTDLISDFVKSTEEDGRKKSSVSIKFAGEKTLEITRTVWSDRKVKYRLNGKSATRQDVVYALREVNGDVNETNTIAQGEINYYLGLTPKERRGLIDITAGIQEFNDKRDDAMRELAKVDGKLNESRIMLNERLGFLKELENEKADAERYEHLTTRIKSINYTILKKKETEITDSYKAAISAFEERKEAQKKAELEISSISSKIEALSKERESKSNGLAAKSAEAASVNRLMEEANKSIAVGTVQLDGLHGEEAKLKEHIEVLQKEREKLSESLKAGAESSKKLKFELEVKQKDFTDVPPETDSFTDAQEYSKRLQESMAIVERLNKEYATASESYSRLSTELSSMEANASDIDARLKSAEARKSELLTEIKSMQEELAKQEDMKRAAEKLLKDWEVQLSGVRKSLSALDAEHIELRERLVMAGKENDKVYEFLKKNITVGFNGRAYELCSYDERYAVAVQAAAGSRLNYFIVDSVAVADKAIQLLKQQRLGRATFIPLDSVVSKPQKGPKDLRPLLDTIRYDKKHAAAFSYIFSNTYLAVDLNEAKKVGFGQYRYVTMEGELVETSGVITGGSIGKVQTPAMIEAKISAIEEERKKQFAIQENTVAKMDNYRRTIAKCETEQMRLNTEIKGRLQAENELNGLIKSTSEHAGELSQRIAEAKKNISKITEEKKRIDTEAQQAKERTEKSQALLEKLLSGKQQSSRASKEEAAKANAQRVDIERLKIAIAELSKEQEMMAQREKELREEISSEKELLRRNSEKCVEVQAEIRRAEQQKTELDEQIKHHGKKTQEIYSEITSLEQEINTLSMQRGKLSSELDRINRDMIETESKKVQLHTRLSDIKAELAAYPKMELLDGRIDDMEKEVIIAKNDLEHLGAVNMRAPEMYDTKKKDADEAQQKMNTLSNEKDSIIAMMQEIESKKLSIFMETLDSVNKNFSKLYSHIFNGNASLHLDDPNDPFNSGLSISLTMGGNRKLSEQSLSGGQRSLIALALVFAIQLRKPMSYYIFDEIDVALDKENSKKLSLLISEMSKKSQFVVVSHNDSMIVAADTAIGVVKKDQKKNNEAQIVGIKLTGKDGEIAYGRQTAK
jgi:chromosome segregation protein